MAVVVVVVVAHLVTVSCLGEERATMAALPRVPPVTSSTALDTRGHRRISRRIFCILWSEPWCQNLLRILWSGYLSWSRAAKKLRSSISWLPGSIQESPESNNQIIRSSNPWDPWHPWSPGASVVCTRRRHLAPGTCLPPFPRPIDHLRH